jgi:hypothetical protein
MPTSILLEDAQENSLTIEVGKMAIVVKSSYSSSI